VSEHTPNGPDRRIDRRAFLIGTLAVGAAAAAGYGLRSYRSREDKPWDEDAFAPPGDARVAVVRADGYDEATLEQVVIDGLKTIGADVAGARILLKPNFVEFDPDTAINTNPKLVGAAVLALRRMGAAEVTVGEGPGHRRDTQYVMTRSGLLEVLSEVDAPFVDLNIDPVRRTALRSHYTPLQELWLPSRVLDADVVISMPKMKTHHWAGVTLSLKNCFGCVPGRVYGWPKNALHWADVQRSILDVAAAVRPRYAIVDGIVGMQGNGPISGEPVHAGLLVFGDDPVATDVIATTLMGFDPEGVAYVEEAGRFLGQANRERIVGAGEDPDSLITPFLPAPGTQTTAG
jgi:uncharacterized protein (DUF362 family)